MAMRWRWPPESAEARLADPGVVAQRQPLDELVGVGHLGRPHHRVHVGLLLAEGDVAGDGVVEEVVLLQHEADLPAEVAVVERLEVDAVVEDGALGRLEQPGQALDQRGLARSRSGRRSPPWCWAGPRR